MSKRLQVVVDESEFQGFEESAKALGLTLSGWVRQALRAAEREVAIGDVEVKLAAIRGAFQHSFPAAGIDAMLSEIEQGYITSVGS
jgi:hypothetical protein